MSGLDTLLIVIGWWSPSRCAAAVRLVNVITRSNPAQLLAEAVHPHFAQHIGVAQGEGANGVAPVPPVEVVETIIEAAFWASLRREEGLDPKTSLAFLEPAHTPRPMRFAQSFGLEIDALTKLAPAVERPGIHLGICHDGADLRVWGTTRDLPAFCFVVEVVAPGLLVVKHSRPQESGKFVNVAVLEGDRIKILNERAASLPDCPGVVSSLFGLETDRKRNELTNVLIQLAVSMRAHGRGGSLLVVPSGTDQWRQSILKPLKYGVSPPFDELADLVRSADEEKRKRAWQESLRRAVAMVGGLTAVDGATIINDRYEVLAFGAKITRRDGNQRVEQVIVTEPVLGNSPEKLNPAQLGGTRHLSAAQFAQDQKDALALVASQDGNFTVFAWSPCEAMVHAHRVEALLL